MDHFAMLTAHELVEAVLHIGILTSFIEQSNLQFSATSY